MGALETNSSQMRSYKSSELYSMGTILAQVIDNYIVFVHLDFGDDWPGGRGVMKKIRRRVDGRHGDFCVLCALRFLSHYAFASLLA